MPSVFFTASGQPTIEAELALFAEAVLESDLPDSGLFRGQAPATWDAAEMLDLSPADAFDAHLVSGGLPLILDEWPTGMKALDYVTDAANDPRVDLIGADREPVARQIAFVGSVKWRDSQPFDERDLADLIMHRSQVPGTDDSTPLLAVSRSGMRVSSLPSLGPQELLDAWR